MSAPDTGVIAPPLELATVRPALQPVALPLPRLWIGFLLASLCFPVDILGWVNDFETRLGFLLIVGLPLNLLGWIYWLFCIHRLHLILARATDCTYPVRPRRAVGLQMVPFYSWVWRFKWAKQIAHFVNLYSPMPMKVNRPGVLLVLGSVVGILALLAQVSSLRLFLLFGVTLYLTRSIKKVLRFTDAVFVERRKQLDMALTAGLGAAIGFLLIRALYEFSQKSPWDMVKDGVGILLLSLILSRFIEPLIAKVRAAAGMETDHPADEKKRSWLVRAIVFLALVFSNFFHDLLHGQMEHFDENWQTLVVGLVVCGGITYFWISGIRQEPRKAARFGVVSGAGIAFLVTLMLGLALGLQKKPANPDEAYAQGSEASLPHVEIPVPIVGKATGTPPHRVQFTVPFGGKSAGTSAWAWALLGLVGGLAIDKKWGRRGLRSVALGMLSAALLFAVAWVLLAHLGSPVTTETYIEEIWNRGADVGAVGGWCLGLLLHPTNIAIFGTA